MNILSKDEVDEKLRRLAQFRRGDIKNIAAELFSDKTIIGYVFNDVDLASSVEHNVSFKNCQFVDTRFNGSWMRDWTIENCVFINCNFVKDEMPRLKSFNSQFRNCSFSRSTVSDGKIADCIFEACEFLGTLMVRTELERCVFTGSITPLNVRSSNTVKDVTGDITRQLEK